VDLALIWKVYTRLPFIDFPLYTVQAFPQPTCKDVYKILHVWCCSSERCQLWLL